MGWKSGPFVLSIYLLFIYLSAYLFRTDLEPWAWQVVLSFLSIYQSIYLSINISLFRTDSERVELWAGQAARSFLSIDLSIYLSINISLFRTDSELVKPWA